ncbi:MAG: Uma2 family endonuclease [Janthinobacterium lividum]
MARAAWGPPDFIIEVTAPGSAARDWRSKFDLYEENGVGEYWIVSPAEQSIAAFVRDEATGRYRLAGEYGGPGPVACATLPGLGLEWSDIFPNAEV